MDRHADSVWSAVSRRDDVSAHARSWRRCVTVHGLDPAETRKPLRIDDASLRHAQEASEALRRAAGGEIDRLGETLDRAGCCLVLTNAAGLILDRRGVAADDRHFETLGLWSGAVWDEAGVGTNGIGTALAEQRAAAVHRNKHFFEENAALSCVAAPIRDHEGRLAGAIDVSSCRDDVSEPVLGVLTQIVQDAASRIETTLFQNAYPGARMVVAPGHGARLGLLAVDRDDIVVGANAAARRGLRLDDAFFARERHLSDVLGGAEADAEDGVEGIEAAERRAVRAALARTGRNVSAAARLLGISRATLHRKIKRLDIR